MRLSFLIVIFSLLFFSNKSYSQANGYILEFDSAILLTLDTVPMPPNNTTRTKSFTVPAGMILKINSGYLLNICVATNPITYQQKSTLTIGNKTISPMTTTQSGDWFRINFSSDNAIWANAGETVTLKFENTNYSSTVVNGIAYCWIGGVLFRKIPN